MACTRCNKNHNRVVSTFLNQAVSSRKTSLLSAPVLTAQGWVRTCTGCGLRTAPASMIELIVATCNCQKDT